MKSFFLQGRFLNPAKTLFDDIIYAQNEVPLHIHDIVDQIGIV